MDGDELTHRARGRPLAAIARMPTGAKVFLILSAGLLPLAQDVEALATEQGVWLNVEVLIPGCSNRRR